jgi:O-Antigen ligase
MQDGAPLRSRAMRRAVLLAAAAVLLGGPTALAFFSGGYFDEPRLIATLVAWVLVLVVALASPSPLPGSWPAWLALAGLAGITAWTGVSISWAPLSSPATGNLVRLLLYIGALVAAVALLRERLPARALEPALALGSVVVIGYGLAGRVLPGVVHLSQSRTANGRLEQPITYWNAEGALSAVGLVLCARLAGDRSRPVAMRAAAAAAAAPLGAGVYLSFSRGAIAAAVVGLIVLLAAAPSWAQLRAAGVSVAAGVAAAAVAAVLPGVASLDGSAGARERDGAIMLGVLLLLAAVAAGAQAWSAAAERRGRVGAGEVALARRLPGLAGIALALGLAGLVVGGLGERGDSGEVVRSHGASRLVSLESRRYDYWKVGLRAFGRHPLKGVGSGGFRVEWLRERPVPGAALEVHSLPLEMATELGLVGLLGFAMLVGGASAAAVRALRRGAPLAPGAAAAATVWFLHAAIDWDWQIPAVSLPALLLAGGLIAASERGREDADRLRPGDTREREPSPGPAPATA